MKRFFSLKTAVIFLSAAAAVLSVLLVKTTSDFNKNKQILAETNYSHWMSIAQIANDAKTQIASIEDIKNNQRILYSNAVIYNVSDLLLPGFSGEGFGFMRITYDALLQQLAHGDLSQEKQKKGLALFLNMNHDLISICKKVSRSGDDKAALIDHNSNVYQELQTQMETFVTKYTEEYEIFNGTK